MNCLFQTCVNRISEIIKLIEIPKIAVFAPEPGLETSNLKKAANGNSVANNASILQFFGVKNSSKLIP